MGFRDYYQQFDDIDEAALNLERRERRRREKEQALERLPDIDLSGTEWPDLPHSEIANAAIARARGRAERLPGPPRHHGAPPAGRAPLALPRADRTRERRRGAAAVGRPGAALPR